MSCLKKFSLLLIFSFFYSVLFAQSWSEVLKTVASDRDAGDGFGVSVAVSGSHAIVGAQYEDEDSAGSNTLNSAGAAYILEKVNDTWHEVQKIVPSDRNISDQFGHSVDISGNVAIIGSFDDEDENGLNTLAQSGSVYVFEKINGVWLEVQKLVASDRSSNDQFGTDVSISGNHVIIGARYEDHDTSGVNTIANAGSAYIFEKSGNWVETQKIAASDRLADARFGSSVSIDSGVIVIGSPGNDTDSAGGNSLNQAGAIYIFEKLGGTWAQSKKISVIDRDANDNFGNDVSVHNDIIIAGANRDYDDSSGLNPLNKAGAAYIFEKISGNWFQTTKLDAFDRQEFDEFGWSVDNSNNYVIIGARYEDQNLTGLDSFANAGSAYIFRKISGNWNFDSKIVPTDRSDFDAFGWSVAISANDVLVGARSEDEDTSGANFLNGAGSVYHFQPCIPYSKFDTAISCGSYTWNLSGITYSTSGIYNDTVINASGCDTVVSLNLTILNSPNFTAINVTDLQCYGDNDGEALLIPTAGPAPYSYYWTGPSVENGPYQQNLHAGTYQVQMTDANGCQYTDSVIINSPPEIIRSYNVFSPTCGNYNGAIDLSASGGTGNLKYQWNTGDTTEDINAINANFYTVTITDAIGCVEIEGIPVSSQGGPSLSVNSITPVSCHGMSDGAIDVDISGIYQVAIWANGGTSEDLTNIPAGPYHLIVADTLSGCISVLNATVPQADPIILDVITTSSICNDSTGTATLNIFGGNGGGSINWSNGSGGTTATTFAAGVYSVQYTDSKGCSDTSNFAISDEGAPLIFLDSIINVPCGGSTGEIQVTTTGNIAQNIYSWNNGQSTEDLVGAGPGNYTLNITDPIGCQSYFVDDIERIPAGIPEYCHTMFDSSSQNNIVIWNVPSNLASLTHYSIWKESSQAGFYQKIGESSNIANGIFYDTITNPNASYARYKVSIHDSCGLETTLSSHRKTVHLNQAFGVIPNTVNLSWDNYEGNPVTTWLIYRNSQTQGWELIDSLSSNTLSYTDQPSFQLSDPELYYVVKAQLPLVCNSNFDMIRSNNSNSETVLIPIDEASVANNIQIFPNPFKDRLYIKYDTEISNITIMDMKGRELLRYDGYNPQKGLEMQVLAAGVYMIKIDFRGGEWISRLVKE